MAEQEPYLFDSSKFTGDEAKDFGTFEWDPRKNDDVISHSNENKTIEWTSAVQLAWVSNKTKSQLHSGTWYWEFKVENMGKAQIGVGFLLKYNGGVDWGFFGYLGASNTGWSYDPSTGDIVSGTESILGKLPKFKDLESGIIALRVELPKDKKGNFTFIIDGVETAKQELPASGAVIVPAATLLKRNQKVTLQNLKQIE